MALKCSLFPLDITLDLLRAMTLCRKSQMGGSEGVLMTKHMYGFSGYERRSHFCFSVPCLLSHEASGDIVCVCTSKCSEVTPEMNYMLDKHWKCKHSFYFLELPSSNFGETEKGLEALTEFVQGRLWW